VLVAPSTALHWLFILASLFVSLFFILVFVSAVCCVVIFVLDGHDCLFMVLKVLTVDKQKIVSKVLVVGKQLT